jgi:presenilin 1
LYEATLPSDAKLGHASFADHSPSRDKSPPRHHSTASSEVKDDEKSIKLGLGDFVFYSVLVSKAALYGFTTCAVCFLVIILGLGITLALLSVYRVALPALPISIALGVAFYLLAREASVPLLEATSARPIYF